MTQQEARPERGGLARFYVGPGIRGDRFYVLDGQTGQPVLAFEWSTAVKIVELLNTTGEPDGDP